MTAPTMVSQAIYDGASVILTATQTLQELRRTDQTLADKRKLIDAERALHQARRVLLSVYPKEEK